MPNPPIQRPKPEPQVRVYTDALGQQQVDWKRFYNDLRFSDEERAAGK